MHHVQINKHFYTEMHKENKKEEINETGTINYLALKKRSIRLQFLLFFILMFLFVNVL